MNQKFKIMKTILHKSLKRMSFTLMVAMISFSTMGQSVYDVISNSPNHTTLTAAIDADNGVVHAIDKVLIPGTASTDKYEIENLSIYPNPTTHFIQVENMDNSRYIILNNAGQKVKEGVIESNKVSVAELNTGMYFINILKNEKIFS